MVIIDHPDQMERPRDGHTRPDEAPTTTARAAAVPAAFTATGAVPATLRELFC
jgi:hypothetical protein